MDVTTSVASISTAKSTSTWRNAVMTNKWTSPMSWKKQMERRKRQRLFQSLMNSRRNKLQRPTTTTLSITSAEAAAIAPVTTIDATTIAAATTITATTTGLSKMDVALFITYFCNVAVVTLSILTVPAMAMEYCASPHARAAFVASAASMAPLGGGVGKIINGFVCQRLGGRQASWMYLVGLSAMSMTMSMTTSLASIGWVLIGYEFLSSIQWTSICDVLDQHYRQKPELMSRGITLLSISSVLGALAAKTIGAGLLQATHWRTVCRFGSLAALLGAGVMYAGVKDGRTQPSKQVHCGDIDAPPSSVDSPVSNSPLHILKSILGNKLFWMIGIAHSLGFLAKGSDRILGQFLQHAASVPSKFQPNSKLG
jgi:hypothetical protein